MPRGKKRTPRKASITKEAPEKVSEEPTAGQECEESVKQASEEIKDVSHGEADAVHMGSDDLEMSQENEETGIVEPELQQDEDGMAEVEEDMDEGKADKCQENTGNQTEGQKKEISIEDIPVTPYMPHTIPDVMDSKLKEKWEWHMQIYPIDQSDIRRCVLDSVSKIAQETWLYIDKNNYGMGSYDLCLRNHTDAAMVMLKTLRAPMMYRYVTVKVTKRGKDPNEIKKIKQCATNGSSEESEDGVDDGIEKAIEKLPYSEVLETATLHLDYVHTIECDKTKGKEKKRSLYVKYLPECTTKELLKVLFPVAINLDFISTGAGRRIGDLDVVNDANLRGVLQAYVAVYINGCKNIGLGWNKENLDDGNVIPISDKESPWEVLPRSMEVFYEAVPEVEEDGTIQYRKRKRELDIQHKRAVEMQMRRKAEKRRESRWDGDRSKSAAEIMQMQRAMNAKIQNQLALLQAVGEGPPHPRGLPPMMRRGPEMTMGPMESGMKDRKRDRYERDRMDMEMGPMQRDFPPFGGMDRGPNRMGPPDRQMRGRMDFMSPRDRDRMFEGGRGRGGGPMGVFGGRGGRFDRDSDRGWSFEGRFGGGDGRGRGFDLQARAGQYEKPGHGRGGGFDMPSKDGFDSRGGSGRGGGGAAAPFARGGPGRGNSSDETRNSSQGGISNIPPKVGKTTSETKETGAGERIQSRDQRSGGKGGLKSKPTTHSFPSNFEKPTDGHRTLTQVTISNENRGNKNLGPSNVTQRQNNFGNQRNNSAEFRSGFGSLQNRGFSSQSQQSGFGTPQNRQSNFDSQNRQSNFDSQNRQSNFDSQNRQGSFGSPQNRQNNFGSPQNRQSHFGSSQNQQNTFGNSQSQQRNFGPPQNQRGLGGSQNRQNNFGSGYQQSGFGSSGSLQSPYGSQSTSYSTSGNQQSSFGSTMNQQSSYGSSQSQHSYGSNQQSSYSNQQSNYISGQIAQSQQSSYGSLQSQNYGSQQGYGSQQSQTGYGSYSTQQQQQQGYSTMQQQNYGSSQSYDSQQQGYGSQQQQQGGFGTTGAYDWNQQSTGTGVGGTSSSSGNYSQSSFSNQQGNQDYNAYSQQGQSAYSGYGSNSVPSTATGYGADSAFANQGFYTQGSQSLSDSYGSYSASDGYGTGSQQTGLSAYSYGQYQGNA